MGEGPVNGMRTGRSRRRWHRSYTAVLAAGALAVGGAASATIASASTSSAGAGGSAAPRQRRRTGCGGREHHNADQAPRRHLPGERVLRPLLRDVPERDEPVRRAVHAARTRRGRTTSSTQGSAAREPADQQPERMPRQPVNPRRLDPANINDVLTCDQDHGYTDEQKAFDGGADGQVRRDVGTGAATSPTGQPCGKSIVMDYYDGNTVTGLWNYAQHFAMSDNSFGTTFGPSTPGAINLVSGQTGGVGTDDQRRRHRRRHGRRRQRRHRSSATPSRTTTTARPATRVALTGQNIGDLLNAAGVTWGWFQGGFRPTTSFAARPAAPADQHVHPDQFKGKFAAPARPGLCNAVHRRRIGDRRHAAQYGNKDDYIPHHEPFQYYASTANPHHLPPTVDGDDRPHRPGQPPVRPDRLRSLVGASRTATVARPPARGQLPQGARRTRTATPATPTRSTSSTSSSTTINALEHSPDWSSTAVIIAYDDSDGWYDHVQWRRSVNPSAATPPTQDSSPAPACAATSPAAARRPTRTAAATARACRCWSSRRGRSATTSTTR